jgi:hypothetical protein
MPTRDGELRLRWAAAGPWSRRLNPKWAWAGQDGLKWTNELKWLGSLEVEAATRQGLGTAALRPAYCVMVTRASHDNLLWARPCPAGPGVLPLHCQVNDCISVVEVGSSRVVIVRRPNDVACSVVQAASQCH